jgi:hypothetical protein
MILKKDLIPIQEDAEDVKELGVLRMQNVEGLVVCGRLNPVTLTM